MKPGLRLLQLLELERVVAWKAVRDVMAPVQVGRWPSIFI